MNWNMGMIDRGLFVMCLVASVVLYVAVFVR